jgi:histidinol-phosphate phosphatase family protein
MTEEELARIHEALEDLLAAGGAHLDAAYYCPNFAGGSVERYTTDTSCRKPATGMVERAVRDLGIDLSSSFVVGDQLTDVELAQRAGVPAVLVMTGKGSSTEARAAELGLPIAHKARDIGEAIRWALAARVRATGSE